MLYKIIFITLQFGMLKFSSPSKNSPLVPACLFLVNWLFSKTFLLWGLKYIPMLALVGSSLVTGALFLVLGIFSLVIIVSYLFTKQFKQFFISILVLLIVSTVLSFIDAKLAPYMIQKTFSNISEAGSTDNKDPVSGKNIISFGNKTPRKICFGEKQQDGLYNCRVCACPGISGLKLYDDEPRCYFYDMNRKNGLFESMDYMAAPCSPVEKGQMDDMIPNIKSYPITKSYSVYKYRNQKLETCDEYLVWSDWDLKNAKVQCEYGKIFGCVVQASSKCSIHGANSICEKEPEMANESYRRIQYSGGGNVSGFKFQEQCRSQ